MTAAHGITLKAADLTRSHVSDVLKHYFSQETYRLSIDRVRLADAGGGRGNLKHQAQLVGAVQKVRLDAVLSEGEQNALGLAGFLTEVESETSGSAVVFDDPVTSLDHVRRDLVASRIAELARDRQVIMFTHDVGFVLDLKTPAEAMSVALTERWVSKVPKYVGHVFDGGPWNSKFVGQRIDEMSQQLVRVRQGYRKDDPEELQSAVRSWYQDLRTVGERALEEVLIGRVSSRGQLELRPSNLGVFVEFTKEDNQEFQTAYKRCGDRGSHDASTALNRPTPPLSELESDLNVLIRWHKRVRQYG